ncbi:MAG TPA: SH3 domain-containing protein [Devosiaceae bacterium]
MLRHLTAICAVAAVMAAGALPAFAATAAKPTAHPTAPLAVYNGPGLRYNVIGRLAKNQPVTLSYCTVSGNWCQLGSDVPGVAGGWVIGTYLVGMSAKVPVTPFRFSVDPFGNDRHHHFP